jgi:spore germination cell wall hydrolase CwlJ-like protein
MLSRIKNNKEEIVILCMVALGIMITLFASYKISQFFTSISPKNNTAVEYRSQDSLLARLITAEADPKDTLDMYLIGSTVLNRAHCSSRFPTTIDSVIFQQRQYAKVDSSSQEKISPLVMMVVKDLYRGVGRDYTVLYFYNPSTATDIKFIRFCSRLPLLYKTRKHLFF